MDPKAVWVKTNPDTINPTLYKSNVTLDANAALAIVASAPVICPEKSL